MHQGHDMRQVIYAVIIIVCMLGSFGVLDAKSQERVAVDKCEEWVKVPMPLRVRILQFGLVKEMLKADLGKGSESLISCLSEHQHMMILDEDIMTECLGGGDEEDLAGVFDRSLERLIFRCLKWIHEGEAKFETDISPPSGALAIE
jgi:hypothetical protein